MFRDPRYFKALREQVLPILRTYPSLKVWVAGCSTGEEVYSLAILLHEEGLLERTLIYATDIHPGSLQVAEAGIYPVERIAQFSRNYQRAGGRGSLADYYTSGVLIYFNAALQDRAIALFRDALVRHGFLGLGSHESLQFGAHAAAFEPVVLRERLFRKR